MQHPEAAPLKAQPGRTPPGNSPPKPAMGDAVDHHEIDVKSNERTLDMQRMAARNNDTQTFVGPVQSRIAQVRKGLEAEKKLPEQTLLRDLVAAPSYMHQFNRASIVGDHHYQLKVKYADWSMSYNDFWKHDILERIPLANQAMQDIYCNTSVPHKQRIAISKRMKDPQNLNLPHDIMFSFVVFLFDCEWMIWRTVSNFKTIKSKAGIKNDLPDKHSERTKEGCSTAELNQLGAELEQFLQTAIQNTQDTSKFESLMEFLGISQSFCETRCLRLLETEVLKESVGRKNDSCFTKCFKNMCGGWQKRWLGIGYNAIWYYESYKTKAETLKDSIYLDQESSFSIKEVNKSEVIFRLRLNRRILVLKIKDLAYGLNAIAAIMQSFVESVSTKSHQFGSFAPLRRFNSIDFFIRGKRYFDTLERIIKEAKYEIVICDWIFSPEFPVTRPLPPNTNITNAPNRILDLLADAAKNRKVNIYIMLYKEFSYALYNDSARAKEVMEALTPITKNIKVICHNEKFGSLWSHHEKMVIVDRRFGLMGGFDIAWGRWDDEEIPLFDYTKDGSMFPGYDYYNPFHKELIKVEGDDYKNKLTPADKPRMPWQDLGISIKGPAVYDMLTHFMTYWNNARELTAEDEEVITGHILLQQLKIPNLSPDDLYRVDSSLVKDGQNLSNTFRSCCKRNYKDNSEEKKQDQPKQNSPPAATKKTPLRANTDYVPQQPEDDASHDESDESLSFDFDYSTESSGDDEEIESPKSLQAATGYSQPPVAAELNQEVSGRRRIPELENPLEREYQKILEQVRMETETNHRDVVWIGSPISQKSFAEDNHYKDQLQHLQDRVIFLREEALGESTPNKPRGSSRGITRKAEQEHSNLQDSINLHASLNSSHSAASHLFKKLHALNPKLEYLFHGLRDVPVSQSTPVTYKSYDSGIPEVPFEVPEGFFKAKGGNMSAQLLRSASPWSIGLQESEHSIYNCYIELILGAKHFIYMENQFFMSQADNKSVNQEIKNKVAKAIYLRIKRAFETKQPFKVMVFIPLLPANEGDLEVRGNKQTQVMIAIQNYSIGEGEPSLYESIRKLGANPEDYIMFGSLRKWAYAPSAQTDPNNANLWLPDKENPKTEMIYIHSKVTFS